MSSTRKMISFVMTSLDGYHEGPDHSIDWHNAGSEEFNRFAVEQMDEADLLVFGRVTYELMAGYWPTQAARDEDPEVATRMNDLPKVVVSRTVDHVAWANTELVRDHVGERLTELKRRPGKDIAIFGSSNLTASLLGMGLVDELRIMINPVVLGHGTPLFQGADVTGLTLREVRSFESGNVLLMYTPDCP
jgi:dihydrofolate reductase